MQKNKTLQLKKTIVDAQIARAKAEQENLRAQAFGGDLWEELWDDEARKIADFEKKSARFGKTIYTCEDFFLLHATL